MTDSNELSEYLAESASEGAIQESGGFTLSSDEAWERLQLSLPKQEFWILKLLQMAVLWRAPEFKIQNEKKGCTVSFEPQIEEGFSSSELLDMTSGDRALQHLRVALAGASADPQFTSVCLHWRSSNSSFDLLWPKSKDFEVSDVPEDTTSKVLRLVIEHGGASWFKSKFGTTPMSQEKRALQERARPQNLRMIWDGEELELRGEEPSSLKRAQLAGSEAGKVYFHRNLVVPQYFDWAYTEKHRRKRGPYGSRPHLYSSDEVLWFQDGVIIDHWKEQEVKGAVNCVSLLDATDLKIDLSGFQVAFEPEAKERVETARASQLKLLEQADKDLSSELGHDQARSVTKKSVFGRYLFLGVLVWPLLLPGLVEIFRLPKNLKKVLDADLVNAKQAIEQRTNYLKQDRDWNWSRVE